MAENDQGGGGTPAFDPAPLIAGMTPEGKEFATLNGYLKEEGGKQTLNVNGLIEGFHNAQKKIGRTDLLEPPDLSNDEKWNAWAGHKVLGVPTEAKDYKFEATGLPKGFEFDQASGRPKMPEGVQWDGELENALRAGARKANIGQKQFAILANELIGVQIGRAVGGVSARAAAKAEFDATMQREYGAGLQTVQAQASMALEHVSKDIGIAPAALVDAASRMMGDLPATKLFIWIAKGLSEDVLKGGQGAGFQTGTAAAKAELERLKTDNAHQKAVLDPRDPGHKAAVEREERLHKQIYA